MYEDLTASEQLVMKCIWNNSDVEMSLSEITKYTNENFGKAWAPQTVSTFLAHIVRKGYIKMKREGRRVSYEILIPESEYLTQVTREFVKFWNNGSVAEFMDVYYGHEPMTKDEAKAIKKRVSALQGE